MDGPVRDRREHDPAHIVPRPIKATGLGKIHKDQPTSLFRDNAVRRNSGHRADATGHPRCLSSARPLAGRSEKHKSEIQSLMRTSYAHVSLKKKTIDT